MQCGLELEYWVVDSAGDLTDPGGTVADLPFVDREAARSLLEVRTEPHDSLDSLEEQLIERLARTVRALEADGKRLVPLGTPLTPVEVEYADSRRIDVQRRVLGERFRYATTCAGAHVHFERVDPTTQFNVLTALDPAFALVTTTPYHDGRRLARCARPYVYRRRAYETAPWCGRLQRYLEDADEWRERLERRFDRFRAAATRKGVSSESVERHFDPETALWCPVRLRTSQPTVEWRAPDATLPSQLFRLVGRVKAILERSVRVGSERRATDYGLGAREAEGAGERAVGLPPFDRIRGLTARAMGRGLDAPAVRPYLERWGFEPDAYRPLASAIDRGPALSRAEARGLRHTCADVLESEVLQAAHPSDGAAPSDSARTALRA